uniref:Ion transport domain-containing protein n=1 Tax=Globisporangium ultimum (strain ATCC 200006 / CBS 805.95 / DAOM BR144) TaxID=431595 RepID=K3WPZ9_GLOUD
MHELSTTTTDCVHDPSFDATMCGFNSAVAYLYFCSFMLLVTSMLLNIFITVIFEGFTNE